MIVLGIETATIAVGVGVSRDETLVTSMQVRPGRRHVETLHPLLSSVLSASRVTPSDLGAVAVDVGPGLFTGLRVGIATAKAFAFSLSLPLVTLSSTEVLRAQARALRLATIAVVDMRRGDVAVELPFSIDPDRSGVALMTPEALAKLLADLPESYLLVGDGARRYFELLSSANKRLVLAGVEHDAPSVATLCELAVNKLRHGEVTDALALEPIYLREADAAINFATRHRQLEES